MRKLDKIAAIKLRTEERLSLPEIAKKLNISKGTLSPWLRDYPLSLDELAVRRAKAQKSSGISRRNKQRKKPSFPPNIGICVNCQSQLTGAQKKYCSIKCSLAISNAKFQNFLEQNRRGADRKLETVIALGGCCSVCGYNKNLAGLCFHHLNDKEFGLDFRAFANRSSDAIKKELAKCRLLCHNCHHEEHYPSMALIGDGNDLKLKMRV